MDNGADEQADGIGDEMALKVLLLSAAASRRRTTVPSCVFAANSLNSVAVRSKRAISIGLHIGVLSMRIAVNRRENPTQADLGNRPTEESIFRAPGMSPHEPCTAENLSILPGVFPISILVRQPCDRRNQTQFAALLVGGST
jgi:hypothetical protein